MSHSYKVITNCLVSKLEDTLNELAKDGWSVLQLTPNTINGTARRMLEEEVTFDITYHVIMVRVPPAQIETWRELNEVAQERIQKKKAAAMAAVDLGSELCKLKEVLGNSTVLE